MKTLLVLIVLFLTNPMIQAQGNTLKRDVSQNQPEMLSVDVYWGNILVEAHNRRTVEIDVFHTDTSKKKKKIDSALWKQFISYEEDGDAIKILSRRPGQGVFESIDISVKVPASMFVKARIVKGGELSITGVMSGVEVDHRNGSVELKALGSHAIVNAANGSITASFDSIDPDKVLSFVTLNGGISLKLPESVSRDVRLISRKNGFVVTDFELPGVNAPVKVDEQSITDSSYLKNPISVHSKIKKGGPLLFISTENGPISIKKAGR